MQKADTTALAVGRAINRQDTGGTDMTTQRKRQHPEDRKRQIVATARDLFIEHGFPNVTMALVARQVDITPGAIYPYFSNKAHLLEAVFADSYRHFIGPLPESSLEATFTAAFRLAYESPFIADLWRRESRYLTSEFRQKLREPLQGRVEAFMHGFQAMRPEISEEQALLLGWASQSVLTAPFDEVSNLSRGLRRRVTREAVYALLDAPSTPVGGRCFVPRSSPRVELHSTMERLLQSAIEQFGEDGYQHVSIDSIGASIGVTGPNLYSYFPSKAALLHASVSRVMHQAWAATADAIRRSVSELEALQTLVRLHISAPRLWTQLRLSAVSHNQELTDFRRSQSEYIAEWVNLLMRVRPELSRRVAHMRVLIVFTVIDDLCASPLLAERAGFVENLSSISMAVLFSKNSYEECRTRYAS